VLPGSAAAWNGRATLSAPFRSEHLGLAYSYYRVGQVQAFSGRESAPQGPGGTILLAGEHTSVDFQGFMEGAAASGRDAARLIAERVGVRRG
jgi:monoamine oxidase